MKDNDNPIATVISEETAKLGFRRKSSNWRRASEEISQVINLQKSNYGRQYYINLGFLPKEVAQDLDEYSQPREERCPIRMRISGLIPYKPHDFEALFDLGNTGMTADYRMAKLRDLIRSILPSLDRFMTVNGLRDAYSEGMLRRAAIMQHVMPLLGERQQ